MPDEDLKESTLGKLDRVLKADLAKPAKDAARATAEKAAAASQRAQNSTMGKILKADISTPIKEATKVAARKAKEYAPTLTAGVAGAAGLAGKGIGTASLGMKALGGAAIGAGFKASGFLVGKALDAMPTMLLYLSAFFLYATDWASTGFNGITFTGRALSLWGFAIPGLASVPWAALIADKIAITLIVLIAVFSFRFRRNDFSSIVSWALLIYLHLLILYANAWNTGLFHIAFGWMYYLVLIRPRSENGAKARYTFFTLLFIDFIGYGLVINLLKDLGIWHEVNFFIFNRLIFPLWFYVVLAYTWDGKKNWLTYAMMILVILINVWAVAEMSGIENIQGRVDRLSAEQKQEAKDYVVTAYTNFITRIKQIPENMKKSYEQGLEDASGGYYGGEEEGPTEEPLGVYLEKILPASSKFYEEEPVVVWGNLRAKTYSDTPHKISLMCNTTGVSKGEMKPNESTVYTLEEVPFECRFKKKEVQPGTHTVNIHASFDFQTDAYLKTYFMDIERMRALRSNNVDVLDNYGVTDKNPVAQFTKGPVKIGIGTNDLLPIGLSKNEDTRPRFGITLENQWNGKIKDIKELNILLPVGMSLERIQMEVLKEDGYIETETLHCNGWFKEIPTGDIDFTTYQLTDQGKRKFELPIETYKSIRCIIDIDNEAIGTILGNTPISTKYYRVLTKYQYEFSKTTSVTIEKTTTKKSLISCDQVCDSTNSCLCPVPCKNPTAENGKTCEGLEDGENLQGAPNFDNIKIDYLSNTYTKDQAIDVGANSQIELIIREILHESTEVGGSVILYLDDTNINNVQNPTWSQQDPKTWTMYISQLTIPNKPGIHELKLDILDKDNNVLASKIKIATLDI
jgi:hypothetical protein